MAFEFELPDVGEGVAEGEIVAWHVEPGDEVAEDQVLVEVETDKAVVDLPSPVAGTVRELHVEEGEVVAVGDVIITIDTDGDADVDEAAAVEEAVGDAAPDDAEAGEEPAEAGAASAEAGESEAAQSEPSPGGRVFAPPHVRRLARELEVDIAAVDGSGDGGRVTEADVRAAANGAETTGGDGATAGADEPADDAEPAIEPADGTDGDPSATAGGSGTRSAITRRDDGQDGSAPSAEAADRERTLAAPATRKLAEELGVDLDSVPTEKTRDGEAFVEPEDVEAFASQPEPAEAAEAETAASQAGGARGAEAVREAATAGERETHEPYRGIRRTIGDAMVESAFTAPHVSHHDRAVVSELVDVREELKPAAEAEGISLTYMPFVMKAVVAALQEYPVLNTTLDEEAGEVVYKNYYNIGVATATEAGLMVPVVEDVDRKGLLQLASEVRELSERARDRSIAREEMQGGTFSITNYGAIGGEYATPIINYPETAILGLGGIRERPVVEDGEVVARHTLPLSLSIDHRVIDGAEAARFTNTVIEYLETPAKLLL